MPASELVVPALNVGAKPIAQLPSSVNESDVSTAGRCEFHECASIVTRFARGDVDQEFSSLSVLMPGGLTVGSRVWCCVRVGCGRGWLSAARVDRGRHGGAGSDLLVIPQGGRPPLSVYVTGPCGGALFGVAVVVRALVGPSARSRCV